MGNLTKHLLKSCQIFGRILIISIIILTSMFKIAIAQECQWLPPEAGGDHYMRINGEIFFYLSLDKSRRLQSSLKSCETDRKELSLREEQVRRYEVLTSLQEEVIEDLRGELLFQRDLLTQVKPSKTKWEEILSKPGVNFAIGFVAGGAAVGLTYYYLSR